MPQVRHLLPNHLFFLIGCFLLAFLASGSPVLSAAGPTVVTQQLDTIRNSLETIDKELETDGRQDTDLLRLRHLVDGFRNDILIIIGDLTPRADALNAQLEQLGAKPEDGAPAESDSIAKERAEKSAALADLNAGIKLAEALLVHAGQISTRISDSRRAAFAGSLFARSSSLFNPLIWRSAGEALPNDLQTLQTIFGGWVSEVHQRFGAWVGLYLAIAVLVGLLLHWLRLRMLPRVTWRDGARADPGQIEKVVKALGIILGRALPVAGVNLVLYMALDNENLLGGRLAPVIRLFLFGIVFLVFMRALSDALFAPDLAAWRLFDMGDDEARHMSRVTTVATTVILMATLNQSTVAAIGASLPLVVLTDGLWALVVAALLAWAVSGLKRPEQSAEGFGPYVTPGGDYRRIVTAICWLAVLAIVLAVTVGYIAFASFIVGQIVWALAVTGIYFLLRVLTDELVEKLPARNSRISHFLQMTIGLHSRAVEQFSVVTAGVIKLVLLAMAIVLIIAPWGVETDDLYAPLQLLWVGFSIGQILISPVDIMNAGLTFAAILFVAHALQRWLENKYLPTTGLDAGIRNSIRTGVGYVGFFIAVALASTQLGLSLSRISLVASALSIGVGFGLQSVVNNFVSGLILLWERPIRVGDWVVVGSEQGYVRRINVRATEIETFDRSSVIIPNSNLVSGVVKNRLHKGKMGRITISIGVAYNGDPNKVRELMVECAKEHPSVLEHPEPSAYLMEFTDSRMRFDMLCFIGNIQESMSITSQLNITVFERLLSRGYAPPRPLEPMPWSTDIRTSQLPGSQPDERGQIIL